MPHSRCRQQKRLSWTSEREEAVKGAPPADEGSGIRTVEASYWITQKGSSAHPRRAWTTRDLLEGVPIQHFSLAVGPWAQRVVQPGDRVLIYWPGQGSRLFMGTFAVIGPVAYYPELPEGWPYAAPLQPRWVIADPQEGLPLEEAMALAGDRIRRFARGACARGLYRIDAATFDRIEEVLRPRACSGDFQALVAEWQASLCGGSSLTRRPGSGRWR
jgi:hypothetical protein